jgi:hypothetical protein
LLNPVALNGFIDAAVSSVTTDEGLDRDIIAALASRAANLDLGKVTFTSVPVVDGNHMANGESTVLWDADAATAMFAALDSDEPLPAPEKAVEVDVAPDDISVLVTGSGPRADEAFVDFQRASYTVSRGDTETPAADTTTVTYDPAWQNSVKTLQAALPGATFEQRPGQGAVFGVEVGSDYSGLTKVRSRNDSPVVTDRTARDDICRQG